MADIFKKTPLSPSTLMTVADRRLGDAETLRKTGDNARANGVFYLGGIVLEILLKAKLLEKYPSLEHARSPEMADPAERHVWSLLYRSHDLESILKNLPELQRRLQSADAVNGGSRLEQLRRRCQEWTIFARYSSKTETMKRASTFLDEIKELKQWLNR